jgi:hypothetical protein
VSGNARDIVKMLNGEGSAARADLLRNYCEAWLQTGRSFAAMETSKTINDDLSQWRFWCLDSGVLEMNTAEPLIPPGTVLWDPPERTEGRPALHYVIPGSQYNARTVAAVQFALLITSPEGLLLGRCKRCQRYFLNTSGHRDKVFCKPACARDLAARRATQRARTAAHAAKCARVRRALAELRQKPSGKYVKDWLAKRAKVTRWWITRAVKRGEISLPPDDPPGLDR